MYGISGCKFETQMILTYVFLCFCFPFPENQNLILKLFPRTSYVVKREFYEFLSPFNLLELRVLSAINLLSFCLCALIFASPIQCPSRVLSTFWFIFTISLYLFIQKNKKCYRWYKFSFLTTKMIFLCFFFLKKRWVAFKINKKREVNHRPVKR